MNAFGNIKKLMELKKQAKKIQGELKKVIIEAEEGNVMIKFNAEQQPQSVELNIDSLDSKVKAELEANILKAISKGIKKSQEVAAENMKGILGDLTAGLQ
ncbi:MAG: YbaB/EbfC family nucleoid-associated protein [Crocinitomicaceae bacterium]